LVNKIPSLCILIFNFMYSYCYVCCVLYIVLRYVNPVVCRKTNGEVIISHENTTMIVWVYGGV